MSDIWNTLSHWVSLYCHYCALFCQDVQTNGKISWQGFNKSFEKRKYVCLDFVWILNREDKYEIVGTTMLGRTNKEAIKNIPYFAMFFSPSIFPFPSVLLSIRSRKNYGLLHVTLSKWHWSIGFPGDFELNSITFFLFLSHSNEGHFSINMTSTVSTEYTLWQTYSLS